MEITISTSMKEATTLLRAMLIRRQISKWNREARKASKNYQYCRQQTAERKARELDELYTDLLMHIERGERFEKVCNHSTSR